MTKSILIIGGTGAQGSAVVRFLSSTGSYELKCITRDTASSQAQELASLPHVSLVSGGFDEQSLQEALAGVEYVWVNTNGFALGEQAETYWSIRIFELSVRAGVKHLVYSGLDSAYKLGNYDPKFRVGHYEGKARAEEFISAQPTEPMAWTCIDSGPYLETLSAALGPKPDAHGTYTFSLPLGSGAMPMIALSDLARYVHWAYQTPTRSTGLRLGVATAHVTGADMAAALAAASGRAAHYQDVPVAAWLQKAFGSNPHGPDTKVGYKTAPDAALAQTFRENFTNWFELYKASAGNEGLLRRDYAVLDGILPDRVKSVEEWMRKEGYTGEKREVLKDAADRVAEKGESGRV